MTRRPIEILLVEDSPADILLIREALEMGAIPKNISVVKNGEHAMDFLLKRRQYAHAPRPDLVLLDINLPRIDGIEVLRRIKSDPELRSITVIVLTTSEAASDINAAYELNANCYVVKPLDYEQFNTAIRGIEEFWMGLASLPSFTPPLASDKRSQEEGVSGNGGSNPKHGPSTSFSPLHIHPPRMRPRTVRRANRHRRRAISRA